MQKLFWVGLDWGDVSTGLREGGGGSWRGWGWGEGWLEQVGRKSLEIEQRFHTNFIIMPWKGASVQRSTCLKFQIIPFHWFCCHFFCAPPSPSPAPLRSSIFLVCWTRSDCVTSLPQWNWVLSRSLHASSCRYVFSSAACWQLCVSCAVRCCAGASGRA